MSRRASGAAAIMIGALVVASIGTRFVAGRHPPMLKPGMPVERLWCAMDVLSEEANFTLDLAKGLMTLEDGRALAVKAGIGKREPLEIDISAGVGMRGATYLRVVEEDGELRLSGIVDGDMPASGKCRVL